MGMWTLRVGGGRRCGRRAADATAGFTQGGRGGRPQPHRRHVTARTNCCLVLPISRPRILGGHWSSLRGSAHQRGPRPRASQSDAVARLRRVSNGQSVLLHPLAHRVRIGVVFQLMLAAAMPEHAGLEKGGGNLVRDCRRNDKCTEDDRVLVSRQSGSAGVAARHEAPAAGMNLASMGIASAFGTAAAEGGQCRPPRLYTLSSAPRNHCHWL